MRIDSIPLSKAETAQKEAFEMAVEDLIARLEQSDSSAAMSIYRRMMFRALSARRNSSINLTDLADEALSIVIRDIEQTL